MRFSTVAAAAGLAASASAAVPKRGLKDLFNGDFKLPAGIKLSKEDLVGPWKAPAEGEEEVYHPPHHDVTIDGCDRTKDDDWHYVHNPHPEETHEEEYKWVTETITATETVIDCDAGVPCDGGKTVTVTIPETVTICPTPIEPPVEEPTEKPEQPAPEPPVEEPPVETSYPEPPVEESPAPEPPVEETPYPEPPVEESPVPEPPVEETPYPEPPVEETPVPEPPVEETPYPEPPHTELPVPPPAPAPTESLPVVEPPVETYPPEVSESIIPPTPTDDEVGVPTAAAVPNAQRAGGALFAAAIAAALF